MASSVDCFPDDSDDEASHSISDVEWGKLKSSQIKEGFREGYSVGQEATLQDAFNKGLAYQVKIDAQDAFYKGTLMALKTYSEKVRNSQRQKPDVGLAADVESRINALLAETDTVTSSSSIQRIPSDVKETNTLSKSDTKGDKYSDVGEKGDLLRGSLLAEGKNMRACCNDSNPSGCQCLQHASEGGSSHEGAECANNCQQESCCKTTPPDGNECMSSSPEGQVASKETSCCKENQREKDCEFAESNPSGDHFKAHHSEGEVDSDKTSFSNHDDCKEKTSSAEADVEFDQDNFKTDVSNKCKDLLIELGLDQLLNVLKLD